MRVKQVSTPPTTSQPRAAVVVLPKYKGSCYHHSPLPQTCAEPPDIRHVAEGTHLLAIKARLRSDVRIATMQRAGDAW